MSARKLRAALSLSSGQDLFALHNAFTVIDMYICTAFFSSDLFTAIGYGPYIRLADYLEELINRSPSFPTKKGPEAIASGPFS
jgi:hypothetical protein